MPDPRRSLPSVDGLLESAPFRSLLEAFPRGRVVEAVREALADARRSVSVPGSSDLPEEPPGWMAKVEAILVRRSRPSLRPVINATGVVLHTNLGRAPLSRATREAMAHAAQGYSNLEFDLEAGARGSRYLHCVDLLREITGAPDALVVNNNAAAVVLALNALAASRDVLVSRGELVEIGGGFRIPDILARSGARLREVGTTNRTRLADYRRGFAGGEVAAILKVHRSNFRITGFTEEATLPDLSALAREEGAYLLHDLGSGLLADPADLGLPSEPRAPESLAAGAHLVAISGDKLLGGPQAGILLGEAEIIARLKENPLCRAFRVDKVTLAGLAATLRHYLDPREALREIPTLRMLSTSLGELERRAEVLAERLRLGGVDARTERGAGMVGGGTYPEVEIPSWTVRLMGAGGPEETARRLRSGDPPVVARIEGEEVVMDLRTVDLSEETLLMERVREASGAGG